MSIDALSLASFWDTLPIRSLVWDELRQDQVSGQGSGATLAYDMGGQLWRGTVTLDSMDWDQARAVHGRLRKLRGPLDKFLAYDPLSAFPTTDPTGSALTGYTVLLSDINADRRRVKFSGLPATFGLREGDMWSVDFGSPTTIRGLFSIDDATVTAVAGVTPWFYVTPNVWPGITAGATVTLIKPTASVYIVPGSMKRGTISSGRVEGSSFQIKQFLS
jgi:hypothetical protein